MDSWQHRQTSETGPHPQNCITRQEFKEVSEKLEMQRMYMNEQFEKINTREERIEGKLAILDAGRSNANAVRAWSQLNPVPIFNPLAPPGERLQMPSNFPERVVQFWQLQRPEQHSILINLLRFYDVTSFANWKMDLLGIIDHEPQGPVPTGSANLEDLVAENPLLALSCLADKLGLDYESIKLNMDMVEKWNQKRSGRGPKRTLSIQEHQREVEHPSKQSRREADDTRNTLKEATVFFAGVPVSPDMFPDDYSGTSIPSTISHGLPKTKSPTELGKIRDQSDEASLHHTEIIKRPGSVPSQKSSPKVTIRQKASAASGDTERLPSTPSDYKHNSLSGVGGDTERLSATPSDYKQKSVSGVGGDTGRLSGTPPAIHGKRPKQSSDKRSDDNSQGMIGDVR